MYTFKPTNPVKGNVVKFITYDHPDWVDGLTFWEIKEGFVHCYPTNGLEVLLKLNVEDCKFEHVNH